MRVPVSRGPSPGSVVPRGRGALPYRLDITRGEWPAEEFRKGVGGVLAESPVLTLATAGPDLGPHAGLAFLAPAGGSAARRAARPRLSVVR